MNIHKEGYPTLMIAGGILLLLNGLIHFLAPASTLFYVLLLCSIVLYGFLMSFFRIPKLSFEISNNKQILAPAEGRIVVIEETHESEYFEDERMQISIFMSPLNVHVNRSPINGTVKYTKYHPGKYLVAWHPKSSTENERFTSVIAYQGKETNPDSSTNPEVLVRQIAGKLARKITNYLEVGKNVNHGQEIGFIKLGSRVDIFLPLGTKINVELEQRVKGGQTVIAELV